LAERRGSPEAFRRRIEKAVRKAEWILWAFDRIDWGV
jgi:hypothetical protein